MPAKLTTMCYVHDCTEKITSEFIIREITAISKVSATDPTKIIYLRVKAFVPINPEVDTNIEEVENGDVIHLVGKFVACESWYMVTATSIKVFGEITFETIPLIGISIMATGTTIQTVRNENGYSILEFEIEEYLGQTEPKNFKLEVKHQAINKYLIGKTNTINQNSRSTTAILVGTINYVPSVCDPLTTEEISPSKFVLSLEDISLIINNRTTVNNQVTNAPWLNDRRSNRISRGATPRTRKRQNSTSPNQPTNLTTVNTLATALEANPPPTITNPSIIPLPE
ncbi:hypothetical protein Glove_21g66 [Diversispora epigaea]|uniref:Uncharacterized protein n=1 Tax=Diversispora epigaea TaxID=1348612 RepID=A0A397JW48_9GLOM|nr:hypothetical protein Glove_21g66 [Diversispora epigaea]